MWVGSPVGLVAFSALVLPQAEIKLSAVWGISYLEFLSANPLPGSFRLLTEFRVKTEVTVFFLAVG